MGFYHKCKHKLIFYCLMNNEYKGKKGKTTLK